MQEPDIAIAEIIHQIVMEKNFRCRAAGYTAPALSLQLRNCVVQPLHQPSRNHFKPISQLLQNSPLIRKMIINRAFLNMYLPADIPYGYSAEAILRKKLQ